MGTYQQYSEIVAAYGTRLPPPSSQPERTRIGLPLLYAAIGVALGTFTGMAAALASLQQPGMAMASVHFSFANSHSNSLKLHPIVNAGQQPVIQNHAAAPAVIAPAQPAPMQDHAVASPAAQPKVLQASVAPKPAPVQAKPVKLEAAPLKIAAVEPAPVKLPAVHHHVLTGKLSFMPPADLAASAAPMPATVTDQSVALNSIPAVAAVPTSISAPISLDSGAKPQVFYSEGDATVANYDVTGDTIETADGRTFVVGSTVSASTATSWDDYRANVHYRCDQNGHCTLTRNGVIALNARLI